MIPAREDCVRQSALRPPREPPCKGGPDKDAPERCLLVPTELRNAARNRRTQHLMALTQQSLERCRPRWFGQAAHVDTRPLQLVQRDTQPSRISLAPQS